jgi:predicted nuclease of restriction endonuclease-like (RecB) superfamily
MGGTEMKKSEDLNRPTFVNRDGMLADKEYVEWLADLKRRYRQSQLRAAVRANSEVLEYYWSLGRDIVAKKAESKWGSGFFNQLSLDMRAMFPGEKGFSSANLRYMKRWYEFYYQGIVNIHQTGEEIVQQPIEEIEMVNRRQPADEILHQVGDVIVHQAGEEFGMPTIFGIIPWKHHVYIFTKSESLDEALFYINKVATEGWSRALLEHHIAAHLFQSQGSAITNFEATLPVSQIEEAKQLLKKEYDLSFITVEAVKEEKDLENALAKNVTEFLLELGQGFAYLGRQKELRIDEETVFFPDLLFYHIPQRRYIIVELKAVKFMPEFAGKLNFYVTAADKLLRGKDDNPSVGLLICKTAKKTIVEWSLQDIQKPLGVATYQLQEVVDRTVAELELKKKQKENEV